jgi:hypothetical protein
MPWWGKNSLMCPHGYEAGKQCEVCYLVWKQYGKSPTVNDPMPKEVAEVEDDLLNRLGIKFK